MRLKSSIEYSIIFLRSLNKNTPTRSEDIANEYGISPSYIQQLAIEFKKKGIITTKKGKKGGFLLNVDRIGLDDVIEIIYQGKERDTVTNKKVTSTILKMFESIASNKLNEINVLN